MKEEEEFGRGRQNRRGKRDGRKNSPHGKDEMMRKGLMNHMG